MVKWEQPRVGRVWLSYVAQDRQKALMGSKEQNKLSFGAQDLLKRPWALSFFSHGLQSTLFTTVGSQRPREIIISGKRAKKSAMGRRVPKSWALLDLSEWAMGRAIKGVLLDLNLRDRNRWLRNS